MVFSSDSTSCVQDVFAPNAAWLRPLEDSCALDTFRRRRLCLLTIMSQMAIVPHAPPSHVTGRRSTLSSPTTPTDGHLLFPTPIPSPRNYGHARPAPFRKRHASRLLARVARGDRRGAAPHSVEIRGMLRGPPPGVSASSKQISGAIIRHSARYAGV